MKQASDQGKLWLVDLLWDLGAIELGIFNLGNTAVNSPIYINAKIPLLRPGPLKKIVNLLNNEIELIKSRRDDSIDNFDIIIIQTNFLNEHFFFVLTDAGYQIC